MDIVIVTGMSGAGKTEALRCLEDKSYYAIDNLPASLLDNIVKLSRAPGKKFERVALVMDVRGGTSFEVLFSALDRLEKKGVDYTILFMDASDDVLARRFSETRRIHPLESEGLRVVDTISEERHLLDRLRERADIVLDTSRLNIHQLKDKIEQVIPEAPESRVTNLHLVSFGYKYGHPVDADTIMDVRFLPNPYWEEELRDLDGKDNRVIEYVSGHSDSREFIAKFVELFESLIPGFEREGRAYLTIGIGCTGGRHRSVVITNEIAERLEQNGYQVSVLHRDIDLK